ncbi:MAG: SpoIIE family protein phosphatase [bacterium]
MQVAKVKRALNDAEHCGDDCAHWQFDDKTTLCVVDGLGHGQYAEKAARAAVDYISRHLSAPLPEILAGCDSALRKTRGAVLGLAVIDEKTGRLTYAGIGNTRARVVGAETIRLSSSYGIIGAGYKALSPVSLALTPGDLLILSTDGVQEMIDMSRYEQALRADVRDLADKIMLDWRHGRDDAAVLVYKKEAL